MNALEIIEHINSFGRCTYKVTEVKVTEVNTKYLLEVFVGPPNADPFSEEGQLRVEIKVFGTLDEANQYMDKNYI